MVLRRPQNWNPVKVEIRALSSPGQCVDPVFKTPVNQKTRDVVHIYDAQVNLGRKMQDRRFRQDTGDDPQTRGWLVMRTCDLAPNSALPKPVKGWKITGLFMGTDQEQAVDWLIEEVRHESQLRGRPLLLYVEFERNLERSQA